MNDNTQTIPSGVFKAFRLQVRLVTHRILLALALAIYSFPICALATGTSQTLTSNTEKKTMAFVNEKIPEQDRARFEAIINYQNLKKQARYIPEFRSNLRNLWTIDRARGVYVIFVTGGGREQLDYYVLVIEEQTVVFNVERKVKGNDATGIYGHWNVHELRIPTELESRREEIKQLIREGLEEMAYLRATADGGTFMNPNTTARGNIISFEVEFK